MNLFEFDKSFNSIIIGTDEAGRGPAAGGVFAAAVRFTDFEIQKELEKLNDSKKLSKKIREELFETIIKNTVNSIVCIEVEEIETINILNASLKAMKLACENVIKKSGEGLVLVDGNKLIKNFTYPQKYVIKGDGKSASIAAASVLAKVSRDKYMEDLSENFPEYLWAKNAGYLTREHSEAIRKHGVTPHHRKSFLKNILGESKQLKLC